MEYNQIKILLEKYWKCETSVEEEIMLSEYFSGDEVHEEFKVYTSLFRFYKKLSQMNLEGGISFPDENPGPLKLPESQKLKGIGWIYKVAAAVLLMLTFLFIHERYIRVKDEAVKIASDTFEDPQKAYNETKKILLMVSQKYNKGKSATERFSEFSKAEKLLRKSKTTDI